MKKIIAIVALALLSGCKRNIFQERNTEIRGIVWGQSNGVSPNNLHNPVYSSNPNFRTSDIQHKNNNRLDLVHFDSSNPTTHGLSWIIWGDMMQGITNRPIAMINIAHGNTRIKSFVKNDEGYLDEMHQAISKYNPSFLIWIQGESDVNANTSAQDYYRDLRFLVNDVHKLSPSIIIYVALDSNTVGNDRDAIRLAQLKIIQDNLARKGVDVDSLRTDPSNLESTFGAELGGRGLEEHAKMWFDLLCRERPWDFID